MTKARRIKSAWDGMSEDEHFASLDSGYSRYRDALDGSGGRWIDQDPKEFKPVFTGRGIQGHKISNVFVDELADLAPAPTTFGNLSVKALEDAPKGKPLFLVTKLGQIRGPAMWREDENVRGWFYSDPMLDDLNPDGIEDEVVAYFEGPSAATVKRAIEWEALPEEERRAKGAGGFDALNHTLTALNEQTAGTKLTMDDLKRTLDRISAEEALRRRAMKSGSQAQRDYYEAMLKHAGKKINSI